MSTTDEARFIRIAEDLARVQSEVALLDDERQRLLVVEYLRQFRVALASYKRRASSEARS